MHRPVQCKVHGELRLQTDVLRALVRADVFKWEEKHQETFEALKNAVSADTVLAYFDPDADHEVHRWFRE